MKKHNQSLVLAGMCAGAFCVASAQAQTKQAIMAQDPTWSSSPASRFYVGASAGGVITPDTRVKSFLGSVDPNTKVRLDPGVYVGFIGGYKLTDWFPLE